MAEYIAITCCVLANKDKKALNRQTLTEVLRELKELNSSMEHNGRMLHTPSLDINECCLRTAFDCFKSTVLHLKVKNTRILLKFSKGLRNPFILQSLDLCKNSSQKEKVCQTCDSYPKKNSKEFLGQLESLLQKIMTTLV